MCKLFAAAGIQPAYAEHTWKILEKASQTMCRVNDDGFGFAALTGQELWGERWYDPNYAFKVRAIQVPPGYEKVLKGSNVGWSNFGERPQPPVRYPPINALLGHARKAAGSPKSPKNVHPFVKDSAAFIHNGVVTDFSKKVLDLSGSDDCDSMGLFNRYLERAIPFEFSLLEKTYDEINGGMVCITLAHDGSKWIMDIWKNDYNSLYAVKLKDGHRDMGLIWTTDVSDIAGAIIELQKEEDKANEHCKNKQKIWHGVHALAAFAFESGNALRVDATTGGFVAHSPFPKETYGRTNYITPHSFQGGGMERGGREYFHGGGRTLVVPPEKSSGPALVIVSREPKEGTPVVDENAGVNWPGYGMD